MKVVRKRADKVILFGPVFSLSNHFSMGQSNMAYVFGIRSVQTSIFYAVQLQSQRLQFVIGYVKLLVNSTIHNLYNIFKPLQQIFATLLGAYDFVLALTTIYRDRIFVK